MNTQEQVQVIPVKYIKLKTKHMNNQSENKEAEFDAIKWAVGAILFDKIQFNESKTGIECNPAAHAIAEYFIKLKSLPADPVEEKEGLNLADIKEKLQEIIADMKQERFISAHSKLDTLIKDFSR